MTHERLAVWAGLALGAAVLLQLSACGAWPSDPNATGNAFAFESTFQKVLARAQSGHPESQNAAGYMLYHGEGVPMDRVQAKRWFMRAAKQGNVRAQRNLAIMAAPGSAVQPRSVAQSRLETSGDDLLPGERTFLVYCSGCHGVNGISAYEHSPSFAFGEQLDRSDAALMRSLLEGTRAMPAWDGKLFRHELREVLRFIRTLRDRYEAGIGQPLRAEPDYYYLFGPMEERRLGMPVTPQ